MTRRIAALVAALVLGGCMVGPDYSRPGAGLPAEYPEAASVSASAEAGVPLEWWRLYQDPLLDDLVATALADNADLAQAVARVDEARAVLQGANAAFFPEFDLSGNAGRQAFNNATPTPRVVTGYSFAISTNYELDFWGRLRRASESAQQSLFASRYGKDVIALSLASLTAQTYFNLRGLDALIAVTRENLGTYDATLSLTRRRAEGGVASDLDLRQAEGQRQFARVQLADLVRQRAAALHQLQLLTARLDLDIPPGDLRTLPLPVQPPAGLPSTLLERRPDVRQAEAQLAAQNARIGVARAAMFPTISLTGDYGGSSADLGNLLAAPGRIWSIGFGLALPLFDAGRRAAATQLEEARTREAIAAYQKAAQSAFREVQDALSNVRQYAAAEEDARLRTAAAAAGVALAQKRYDSGLTAFLDLLIQQRTLYEAQLAEVQNHQALVLATVDLMRALGGGWQASDTTAAAPVL